MRMKREFNASVGWVAKFSGRDRRFQWVGRDRTGVSRWEGERDALSLGATVVVAIGFVLVTMGVGAYAIWRQQLIAATYLSFSGIFLSSVGWWMRKLHCKLKDLHTAEGVASATGIDRKAVERLADEQEIKPRAILNGEYLYDPQDLLPGARLLRASQRPSEEALLRPAGSKEVSPECLVRASERESETIPQAQDVSRQPQETPAELYQA